MSPKESDEDRQATDRHEGEPPKPGFWQVTQSILAAAFGVQTEEARKRDFTRGNPLAYIIGGTIFTVLLIVALVVIVNLVLRQAGV